MQILGSIQTGTSLGRQRAARVRRDVQLIDQALGDAQLSTLAETELHLAAEIIEREGSRDDDPTPLSDEERKHLFGQGPK